MFLPVHTHTYIYVNSAETVPAIRVDDNEIGSATYPSLSPTYASSIFQQPKSPSLLMPLSNGSADLRSPAPVLAKSKIISLVPASSQTSAGAQNRRAPTKKVVAEATSEKKKASVVTPELYRYMSSSARCVSKGLSATQKAAKGPSVHQRMSFSVRSNASSQR